jgi:hypothetical protein
VGNGVDFFLCDSAKKTIEATLFSSRGVDSWTDLPLLMIFRLNAVSHALARHPDRGSSHSYSSLVSVTPGSKTSLARSVRPRILHRCPARHLHTFPSNSNNQWVSLIVAIQWELPDTSQAQMVDAFRWDGSITETRVREQANTILVLTALHAYSLGHSAQG